MEKLKSYIEMAKANKKIVMAGAIVIIVVLSLVF